MLDVITSKQQPAADPLQAYMSPNEEAIDPVSYGVINKTKTPSRTVLKGNTRLPYVNSGLYSCGAVHLTAKTSEISSEDSTSAKVHLLGAVQVINAVGTDITPKGKIRKALFALLCTGRNGVRSRAFLQSMLWGDRDERQASASLRNAISVLKTELSTKAGGDAGTIKSDNSAVRIDLSKFDVDVLALERHDPDRASNYATFENDEFLQGIDLPGGDNEEFETWLRSQRSYYQRLAVEQSRKDETAASLIVHAKSILQPVSIQNRSEVETTASDAGRRPIIALLNSITIPTSEQAQWHADTILDEIAGCLVALCDAEIIELRDVGDTAAHSIERPDILIRIRTNQSLGDANINVLAYRAENLKRVWSNSITTTSDEAIRLDSSAVSGFISHTADSLAHVILREFEIEKSQTLPYSALRAIFNFEHPILDKTHLHLTNAVADDKGQRLSNYYALLAYLNTFKIGEAWGKFDQDIRDETRAFVQRAMQENPFNPITQTLIGHVLGYVLGQHDLAGEWLKRAVMTRPTLAFAWDHYALHFFYTGDLERANKASEQALTLGSMSPIRHTFETTKAMIATIGGDYDGAVRIGEKVLMRTPNSSAALRYTAMALIMKDEVEKAGSLIDRLTAMNPDFGAQWLEQKLGIANNETRRKLIHDLKKKGLKN